MSFYQYDSNQGGTDSLDRICEETFSHFVVRKPFYGKQSMIVFAPSHSVKLKLSTSLAHRFYFKYIKNSKSSSGLFNTMLHVNIIFRFINRRFLNTASRFYTKCLDSVRRGAFYVSLGRVKERFFMKNVMFFLRNYILHRHTRFSYSDALKNESELFNQYTYAFCD